MFITSKRQPKINSIRQYTKWPKLEIFSNFWKIKISLKNALELNFGTSKEFSSLFTWHWARSIFSNFWIFWNSWIFKNSKIIEIVFDRFFGSSFIEAIIQEFHCSIQECSTNYYGVFKTWIWRRTNAKSELPFNFLTLELWRHRDVTRYDVIYVT